MPRKFCGSLPRVSTFTSICEIADAVARISRKKIKMGTIELIRSVATPAAAAFQKAGRFSVGIRGFIWKKAWSRCVVR